MAEWLKRLLKRNREQQAFCTAVVPAAGSSTRMGGQDKILLTLGDVPVLMHTLRALDSCPRIQEIVVVTREDLIVPISQLCREGGFTKIKSVLDEVIRKAEECGAAAPAVPVKDTIKQAVGGIVERTPDRSELFAVQTPQVFDGALIRGALAKALEEGAALTDDCSAVERIGMKVSLTGGDYTNLKITTPEDLVLAEALLEWREKL